MMATTNIHAKTMHQWPGLAKVAKILDRSVSQVNKLVADGDLKAYTAPTGERRFDPQEVRELADELGEVQYDEEDTTKLGIRARQDGLVLETMVDLVKELRLQNKEAHNANIELRKQTANFFQIAQQSKDNTIDYLSKRLSAIEGTELRLFETYQALLDTQSERDLLEKRAVQRATITQDIWNTTKEHFGELMAQAQKRFGLDAPAMDRLEAAKHHIESVAATPARLDALIETGLVSDEEAALINTILGREKSAKAEKEGKVVDVEPEPQKEEKA
jgi:hypothetical protein